jgi:hypothetical protein
MRDVAMPRESEPRPLGDFSHKDQGDLQALVTSFVNHKARPDSRSA